MTAPSAAGHGEDRRHMIRRRIITAVIIVLLIGIPAGYLIISAGQSRDSGKDKERKAAATGLTEGWPSRVQRRIYQLRIPAKSWHVAFYETNNWRTSRLYLMFQTTPAELDWFLGTLGADRSDLKEGKVTISERDIRVIGWHFTPENGKWSGFTRTQKDPLPSQDITVDMSDPAYPWVYAVSTATP
ncbi:sugar kinase [Streptomyces sp. GC420]|uniref:sugar kinase n=1 Tax=Streptomyces sp. GC420 TaxID=2697568 RepID=UPI0014152691|nr:sugar kinase [Streptomyces sp. GC420]NBM15264.1 sugar kinase [Streptomyces sp. GC420]